MSFALRIYKELYPTLSMRSGSIRGEYSSMSLAVITEESIKLLIDSFYKKVRADVTVGPVFAAAIGTTDEQWQPHLQRMYDFWSSVMLTSGRYHGNPLQKHRDLPPFTQDLFDVWLALFAETAREIHVAHVAQRYIDRSERIAESLKMALYYSPKRRQGENITRRRKTL